MEPVEVVWDLVRREGVAHGIEALFRLSLSIDIFTDVKEKCEATLAILESWRGVAKSTDVQAGKGS
jgi:hypothetical protein